MTLIQTKQKPAREQKQVQTKNKNKNNTFQSDTPAGRRICPSESPSSLNHQHYQHHQHHSHILALSPSPSTYIIIINIIVAMVMLIFCNLFCCGCSRFSLDQDALRDHYSSQFWLGWHGGGVANSIELTGILQNRNAVNISANT